ncbi:Transposase type 1 [Trinorchestia longiramus]|nr:Transposase type 1 [Trinorchestia longiramus]
MSVPSFLPPNSAPLLMNSASPLDSAFIPPSILFSFPPRFCFHSPLDSAFIPPSILLSFPPRFCFHSLLDSVFIPLSILFSFPSRFCFHSPLDSAFIPPSILPPQMDFDQELDKVGCWGAYQRLVLYSLLMPATLPVAFHAYNQLFMAITPPHWCAHPLIHTLAPHLSQHARMNLTIPYDNATQRYSSCQMYDYNFTEHLADLGLLTPSDEVLGEWWGVSGCWVWVLGVGGECGSLVRGGECESESSNTSFMVMPPSSAQVVPCGEGGWVYQLPLNSTSVVAQLLPISTEHGEKSSQGIGQYKGDSENSGEGRGRLGSLENEQLHAVVEQNPRQNVKEMSQTLRVSIATVSRHLKIIGKVKKLDKWVPHELNENQKLRRFEVHSMLSLHNTNDPFLDRIVTCDEKWVLYDNRKRSGQWLDRDEPPQTLPKANVAPIKIMVTVWWSAISVIHYIFLGVNETINAKRYCNDLAVMHARLSEKRPALVNRRGPILLLDNARPRVARMTIQKLTELGYETLPHPSYSPDLSPTDYHLFKHLKHIFGW